jgi:hypothetical protein
MEQVALFATCFTVDFRLDYSSTQKMEAKCSSETSADFQWIARRYFPEDRTLQTDFSKQSCTEK